MKALYLILALAALSYQAEAVEHTSPTPMDSITKPLKLKKIKNDTDTHDQVTPKSKDTRMQENATATERKSADPEKPVGKTNDSIPGDTIEKSAGKHGFGIPDNGNMAHFPGGERAIREFVKKNKRYPAECKTNRVSGIVTVGMTIAPDGTPGNASIISSSGNELLDAEALRVAGLMPKWTPARNADNGEERAYRMKITFRPGR